MDDGDDFTMKMSKKGGDVFKKRKDSHDDLAPFDNESDDNNLEANEGFNDILGGLHKR